MKSQFCATVDGSDAERAVRKRDAIPVWFTVRDGIVFTSLGPRAHAEGTIEGVIQLVDRDDSLQSRLRTAPIQLCVQLDTSPDHSSNQLDAVIHIDGVKYRVSGTVIDERGKEQPCRIQVVPVRKELYSRARGLIETSVLADKTVFFKGVGSVGSTVIRLLAQSGVQKFIFMDQDRLEVANVIRHEAGLSDIGRYKTKAMADIVRNKNPYAEITTYEEKASDKNIDLVRELVRQTDICIDTGDQREGKLLLNRVCREEGTPLIISGAFRRAYGGQVLRVKPEGSACYQCFVQMLAKDASAYTDPEAETIAYSDRPVPIEPGLSVDIEPIAQMTAKLALQELLKDQDTTLRSLDEDLEANWYLWLNRREQGSQYESWDPLGYGIDGMRVMRWYGINFEAAPSCPVCGDFVQHLAEQANIDLSDDGVRELLSHCEINGEDHAG
ncbi:Sulfur carrier protein ThiS adenylyltransferase [Pontiella desulfatans]|uniref:Sulfur carrier protein ThiS adenylyltransferase n=1 Tax=Pontiella desulfatans TaxID=2750659 RepID=A0A6C2U0K0_PONDE|nr:ThiF family adenylyltransferase [Pontiella desulfatans]VGO13480.1 Sulfur carrier protein ThiS adenylyltransferase [Pontiella desulfatans]